MDQETKIQEEKNVNVKKAKVGDMIEVKRGQHKGKTGEVLIVRDNSVIIQMGISKKTGEPVKTVVNHNNYKRVK